MVYLNAGERHWGETMEKITLEEQSRYSSLIGLIYDSAEQPELWPELLEQLNSLIEELTPADSRSGVAVVDEKEAELAILRPHFQRALQLNRTLHDLKSELDAITSILDRLPVGVILVDENLSPVAINRHAQNIIASGAGLCIRDGKVATDTENSTSRLEKLVSHAIQSTATDTTEKGGYLLLNRGTANPCSLHITPSAHAGIQAAKQLVAIFVSCSAMTHHIGIDALTETYRLTEAEGRLLQRLLNGCHSLPEAAASLGVSKHTVRSQFKSILEKTGTHSQTELIKRILTDPTALIGKKEMQPPANNPVSFETEAQKKTPSEFKVLNLMDGRKLEYREYGDPKGTPVLFFHGCIHSRDNIHPTSRYAESHSIRLIAPERPGFGESSLLPDNHEPTHYAKDIAQLLMHLNIDSTHILADASGAQAGLLCACSLPGKVKKLSLISIYPEPRFDVPEKALKAERLMLKTYQALPSIFYGHISRTITRSLSRRPENYFGRVVEQLPPADREIIGSPEHQSIVAESFKNAYPNHVQGFTDDFMQRAKPWNFDITRCHVEVHLWHGTANAIVPFETAEKIADALPDASLHPVTNGGHYIIISHWDEVLKHLVEK